MRHATAFALLLATAIATPALAAPDDAPPRIVVGGSGQVFTPRDLAAITYTVRGEGETSDAVSGGRF